MEVNEQFTIDRQDSLRKELEDKVDDVRKELDTKIEKKISEKIFFWTIGTLILGAMGYFVIQINTINGKIDNLSNRVITIETKMEGFAQVKSQK